MNPETLAIVMFFTLFVGLMLGHPLAFTLGMLAVVFGVIGWGGSIDAVLALLGQPGLRRHGGVRARGGAALHLHGPDPGRLGDR